jgi:DNA-binding winged helix-turn-helix (wHTH) protein
MSGNFDSERLFFGAYELDTVRRALCCDGEDVRLPPKEYEVLACLVRQAGRAVSREELMASVWPGVAVGDASLARCISALRKRLGVGAGAQAIEAVPKFGYRFALPVSTESPYQGEARTMANAASPAEQYKVRQEYAPVHARRGWWMGTAAGLLLLLGVLLALRQVRAVRAADAPTWSDPQTGLTWQRADNGVGRARGQADVDRAEAMQYCAALRLNGRSNWRLPTMEELQTLYNTAKSEAGVWGGYRAVYWHVSGGIQISGGETASDLTWLTDQTPAGEEQSFDFSYGRRNYDPTDFRADHRALCVWQAP